MEYTEEVKKQADEVCEKYYLINKVIIDKATEPYLSRMMSVHCAIQDRQSVLDFLDYLSRNNIDSFLIDKEIQSLTQQISYLKSKI